MYLRNFFECVSSHWATSSLVIYLQCLIFLLFKHRCNLFINPPLYRVFHYRWHKREEINSTWKNMSKRIDINMSNRIKFCSFVSLFSRRISLKIRLINTSLLIKFLEMSFNAIDQINIIIFFRNYSMSVIPSLQTIYLTWFVLSSLDFCLLIHWTW